MFLTMTEEEAAHQMLLFMEMVKGQVLMETVKIIIVLNKSLITMLVEG